MMDLDNKLQRKKMGIQKMLRIVVKLCLLVSFCSVHQCLARHLLSDTAASLRVDGNVANARKISDTMFGVSFEEINNAGAGGLWAELVSNRGFEAKDIEPWGVIGDKASVVVSTEQTSCVKGNKVALKMEILCDNCPGGGVGIFNPGFWGMNIEKGKKYKLIFFATSLSSTSIVVSLVDASGSINLASTVIISSVSNWTRHEVELQAAETSDTAKLQFIANSKTTIWFDQVSLMPMETFNGHGFRKDLVEMIAALKPAFLRFPGGSYVEGRSLLNSFRWKNTVGPWEERPGHFNDVWNYWSDDGLGFLEYLQLAEDIGATPIWVFNSGNSILESVAPNDLGPYLQDAVDGLEFAMGTLNTRWGSVRARMGHPNPFKISYVGVGNNDCLLPHYTENYQKFYETIKRLYPDIKIISNCGGFSSPLPNPADYYDFHMYANAKTMFDMNHEFDKALRLGPKAFVSEYGVTGPDAKNGTLLAALGEAAFLIGLENNNDLVEMTSYAPLLANVNNRRDSTAAIAFNSSHCYGTPSFHMQRFFSQSNGALLLSSTLEADNLNIVSNAILWNDGKVLFIRVKVVNYDSNPVKFTVHIDGAEPKTLDTVKAELAFADVNAENSLAEPIKIAPNQEALKMGSKQDILLDIKPFSVNSFDIVVGNV